MIKLALGSIVLAEDTLARILRRTEDTVTVRRGSSPVEYQARSLDTGKLFWVDANDVAETFICPGCDERFSDAELDAVSCLCEVCAKEDDELIATELEN